MCAALPYLPGQPPNLPSPLERYLPPLPAGVASAWLDSNFKSSEDAEGSFVLDPFGAAPHICFEIARAGYRVLVAANNPVARFLIELAANPPSREQLRGALADLASTRKGEERLEPHIRSLYLTHCDQCGLEVMAESFLWERGASGEAPVPFAKVYHCRACGEQGEHPATREDIERAAQFTGGGLHRARALERVTAQDDPDRTHVEEALSVYLPRAVYVLFTIINKLDSLSSRLAPAQPPISVCAGCKRSCFPPAIRRIHSGLTRLAGPVHAN